MSNLYYQQLQEQSDGVNLKKFAINELKKVKEECDDLVEFHGKRSDEFGVGKREAYAHISTFIDEIINELTN